MGGGGGTSTRLQQNTVVRGVPTAWREGPIHVVGGCAATYGVDACCLERIAVQLRDFLRLGNIVNSFALLYEQED